MATNLISGDLVQFSVFCVAGDQLAVNTYHYLVGAVSGVLTLEEAATDFSSDVKSLYQAVMPAAAQYRGVRAALPNRIPQPAPALLTDVGAGVEETDLLPRAVTGLITWRTAFAGRSYRGRTYVPFPPEAYGGADGEPTVDYVALLDNLAATLQTYSFQGSGGTTPAFFVINSKRINETPAVVGHTSRRRWGTQHRRGDYGRTNISPV